MNPAVAPPVLWTALGTALLGWACANQLPSEPLKTAQGSGAEVGMLDPARLSRILQNSEISYEVVPDPRMDPQLLSEVLDEPERDSRPVDPFLIRRMEDGLPMLRSERPPEAIRDLFDQAGLALKARQLDLAAALYARAASAAPGYFKAHTYAGRTLYLQGRYLQAREALERAVVLNPVDYQAHWFLGDVLLEQGEWVLAKEALTRAFVLNRRHPGVLKRLNTVLEALDLSLGHLALTAPLRLEAGPEAVRVVVGRPHWAALGLCLACWRHEVACTERSNPEEDPLRLTMYRECLVHGAAALAVERDKHGLPRSEGRLLAAIEGGYLEAIVFWEVVLPRVPMVVFLVPPTLRERIAEYIDRYVYVSTQVI